jgi:glycosyltransferase involved in cell wall biosynthesis
MKIALLMSVASPWSRDVALQVARAGQEVHIIDPQNSATISYFGRQDEFQKSAILEFRESVSTIHSIAYDGWGSLGVLQLTWRLRRILRKIRADVLTTLYGGTFALAAYLSMFRPYTVYVVGSDILIGGWFKKSVSRVSLSAASIVFSNGCHLAKKTKELAPRAAVMPLYVGTDTALFAPGIRKASPITIVCSRGFMPIYNNELLIRALSLMPEGLPNYATIFSGPGPDLEKARALADQLLSPTQRRSVQFLGGVSREVLANLLGEAHIYVSVSRSDGASFSLTEALACGAFPILSNIPANQEWIDSNVRNGILVPSDDPGELARALARAIGDEALRRDAGEYNRQLVLERADQKSNMAIFTRELTRCNGAWPLFTEASSPSRTLEP